MGAHLRLPSPAMLRHPCYPWNPALPVVGLLAVYYSRFSVTLVAFYYSRRDQTTTTAHAQRNVDMSPTLLDKTRVRF